MEKTLLVGDHVLVDRITLAPRTAWAPFVYYRDVRRGDIIVFFKPGEPDLYLVKRVIGIPVIESTCATAWSFSWTATARAAGGHARLRQLLSLRDDFPAVPPSQAGSDVTAPWAADLPNYIQGEDLVVPPAGTLPWEITAPSGLERPLLGLCAPSQYRWPSLVRLLVFYRARQPVRKEGLERSFRSIPT